MRYGSPVIRFFLIGGFALFGVAALWFGIFVVGIQGLTGKAFLFTGVCGLLASGAFLIVSRSNSQQ